MYTEKELVGIAKRENNKRRSYLIVNRLQGKHVPADPQSTFQMYDALAEIVKKEYKDEKLLLVGFAETATAIGARLAIQLNSYYMQTTRENIENVEYLYFTEYHSHATEQKLIKTDLDKVIDSIQRIVFVEDEVTTGNTILKIIHIIKDRYKEKISYDAAPVSKEPVSTHGRRGISFSVASILNGMDEQSRAVYDKENIKLHYLVKTQQSEYSKTAAAYREDGIYHTLPRSVRSEGAWIHEYPEECPYPVYRAGQWKNARRLQRGEEYQKACFSLYEKVIQWVEFKKGEKVLVIGTEEFMYPAIFAAEMIRELGCSVKSHSTTRSPIAVSMKPEYPLHERYEIHSFYDEERRTYIYDLKRYDKVIVITDAQNDSDRAIRDLCCCLEECGNSDISIIRWCE